MAYSIKKKHYCVRQALLGITPLTEIARNRKFPEKHFIVGWMHINNVVGMLSKIKIWGHQN